MMSSHTGSAEYRSVLKPDWRELEKSGRAPALMHLIFEPRPGGIPGQKRAGNVD